MQIEFTSEQISLNAAAFISLDAGLFMYGGMCFTANQDKPRGLVWKVCVGHGKPSYGCVCVCLSGCQYNARRI